MTLQDSVFEPTALNQAFTGVIRAMKGVSPRNLRKPALHKEKVKRFEADRPRIIASIIQRHNGEGNVRFVRRMTKINKVANGPLVRPISVYGIEDRVILRSVLNVVWIELEAVIQPAVAYCTFRKDGLHPQRGVAKAVTLIASQRQSERPFMFETDIQAFFDNIDRERLLKDTCARLSDASLDELLRAAIYSDTEYNSRFDWDEFREDAGVPQGSALSPLLACLYLSPFDEAMQKAGFNMLRYVDDLVTWGSESDCKRAEEEMRSLLHTQFKLELNHAKTRHVPPTDAITFLGHEIGADGALRPSSKRRQNVADFIYMAVASLPRTPDRDVVLTLRSYLLGYFAAMEHCNTKKDIQQDVALTIGQALVSRRLDKKRLSRQLRRASKKWPTAFVEALP